MGVFPSIFYSVSLPFPFAIECPAHFSFIARATHVSHFMHCLANIEGDWAFFPVWIQSFRLQWAKGQCARPMKRAGTTTKRSFARRSGWSRRRECARYLSLLQWLVGVAANAYSLQPIWLLLVFWWRCTACCANRLFSFSTSSDGEFGFEYAMPGGFFFFSAVVRSPSPFPFSLALCALTLSLCRARCCRCCGPATCMHTLCISHTLRTMVLRLSVSSVGFAMAVLWTIFLYYNLFAAWH